MCEGRGRPNPHTNLLPVYIGLDVAVVGTRSAGAGVGASRSGTAVGAAAAAPPVAADAEVQAQVSMTGRDETRRAAATCAGSPASTPPGLQAPQGVRQVRAQRAPVGC